ncbi:MAG: DotU family type VI secretion system protein [Burkholderiaceae bacterium]|jgi:type VI secretion system protein ImpK|nr:DotU family type VI secretion system protein [Aquabacterium sp.]NUP85476.1 DotU family type VI secretion system protein [Burkholderiaceae bacterium]
MATDPTSNDPFAQLDGQRTFIKPNPGGGWAPGPRPPEPPTQPIESADAPLSDSGLNPLLAVANKLMLAVPPLRRTRHVTDPGALRTALAQGVRDFETSAHQRGIPPERVMAARYVLCTMLDEAAADTPWGGSGVWGRNSLLASFHNETYGGEKVFQLMARLAEKPDANRDLLELIYAAIALGFEGRYRVIDNGRAQLEAVRDKLAQIIRQQRGPYPGDLAQHWQGQPMAQRRALSWLPLAVTAVLTVLLLVGIYSAFLFSLGGHTDPVYGQIQSLRLAPPVAPVAQPAPVPRLAQFLQSDIKAGLVAVRDEVDRSVVTIRGDGLFASGSSSLVTEREPLMGRIAQALAKVQGAVLVTGHTDNKPVRTTRFPSNWHLSEERARTVRDLLVASGVATDRVRAEGRAEGEPVANNDTDANRALNRRVEVTLFTTRGESHTVRAAVPAVPASGAQR